MDIIIIVIILLIGIGSLLGFKIYENSNRSGNSYARITYENELILMIDLESLEYQVFNTVYKDQIITDRADEGIFYVPGKVTTDMEALWQIDEYAKNNQITGIKLLIENSKISVEYQESPRDICEFQAPTDSHLQPIVCLPNELVIDVYTNLSSEQFVPDAILE